MDEMFERVKRAIEREGQNWGMMEDWGVDSEKLCDALTRTALMVLREPTEEMLDNGDFTLPQFAEGHIRMEHLRVAWQAMIDAVLEPPDAP